MPVPNNRREWIWRRGAYYTPDNPAKRRRLEEASNFVEDVALAAGQPEIAGAVDSATHLLEAGPSAFPAARSSVGTRSGLRRARMPFMSRRRRRWKRKPFASKVRSVVLNMNETKRFLDSVAQATFSAGDGTTRVLYIASPVGNLTQGTTGDDIVGDKIFIKGLWLRGRIAIDQTTNSLRVRILCIGTRQFADLPLGFTTYGNTTTGSTNPTQDPNGGESNILLFETSAAELAGQPSAPYVGNASGIDIIESDTIKVLGGREFFLGTDNANMFKNIDIYVPINRFWTRASDVDTSPADQLRSFKNLNYYWIMQVFSNNNANNILAAQDILGTFDIITYFKDV